MAYDIAVAQETWSRYEYLRDHGHLDFVKKAKECEDFFAGVQWTPEDLAVLRASKRPALTINKILSTISNVMGEQIFNRTEIGFRPKRGGANGEIADILTKVFAHISEQNQHEWVRSDVFADGLITSRGYYDARIEFGDSLRGEVSITQLNPKNVLPDSDAEDYDPDKWHDVVTSKWLSADQISMLYGNEYGKELKGRHVQTMWPYGADAVDFDRDRFGLPRALSTAYNPNESDKIERNIRIIERQYRTLSTVKHFVDLKSGDLRPVPENWDRNVIAHVMEKYGLGITRKQAHRIKWCVVAGNMVLHEDWSPYNHFTVVPYFPYFRRGRTIGLVENLIGPQELLNKVSSQELHVVNTTANSGWKVKAGSLTNMDASELEERGAQTGLVLELNEIDNAEKISPNQIPSGLDRISFKAEEHIKTISGVSDYRTGFAREDVSAKAIKENNAGASANTATIRDNLRRTDFILARNILDLVQNFYSEERLLFITKDRLTGEQEELVINQVTPEGEIANDLTLGEYSVTVTSEPEKDTMEESQFEQAVALRKDVGVVIPDDVIIEASRLRNKADILKRMRAEQESPEAQALKQLEMRGKEAEVSKLESEALQKASDAQLKRAKAATERGQDGSAEAEFNAEMYKIDKEAEIQMYKIEREMKLKEKVEMAKLELEAKRVENEKFAMRQKAAAAPTEALH